MGRGGSRRRTGLPFPRRSTKHLFSAQEKCPYELGPGRRDSATLWGVLIAQALGEYGALSALVGAVTRAAVSAESFIRGMEPSTWAMIGGGVLLLWFLFGRRR